MSIPDLKGKIGDYLQPCEPLLRALLVVSRGCTQWRRWLQAIEPASIQSLHGGKLKFLGVAQFCTSSSPPVTTATRPLTLKRRFGSRSAIVGNGDFRQGGFVDTDSVAALGKGERAAVYILC